MVYLVRLDYHSTIRIERRIVNRIDTNHAAYTVITITDEHGALQDRETLSKSIHIIHFTNYPANHFKLRYKSFLTPIRMADDKVDPPPVEQETSKEKEEKEFEALTGTTEDGEKKENVARS